MFCFLLSFPQNKRKIYYFCSVCIFFEASVFTFQFLNDKIYNYVFFDIIVNFIIQKLKNKPTSFKKYTNWAKLIYFSLVLRDRGEKTKQIFRTLEIQWDNGQRVLWIKKWIAGQLWIWKHMLLHYWLGHTWHTKLVANCKLSKYSLTLCKGEKI